MKNVLFSIIALMILFVTGCKENSITNPIQDVNLQKNIDPSVQTGTIKLERMLRDPYPVMNSHYKINGEIQYRITVQTFDPIPPNPQYLISLNLLVSANFTNFCTVCEPLTSEDYAGTISIETNDYILDSGASKSQLEKTFKIHGREDEMVLKCRFLVTTDSVVLDAMWLSLESPINAVDENSVASLRTAVVDRNNQKTTI